MARYREKKRLEEDDDNELDQEEDDDDEDDVLTPPNLTGRVPRVHRLPVRYKPSITYISDYTDDLDSHHYVTWRYVYCSTI